MKSSDLKYKSLHRISSVFHIYRPSNMTNTYYRRANSIKTNFNLLINYHNAMKKTQRELIEMIYSESKSKYKQFILTNKQTTELNNYIEQRKKEKHISKSCEIPKKKVISNEEEIKKSKVSLLEKIEQMCNSGNPNTSIKKMINDYNNNYKFNECFPKQLKLINQKIIKGIKSHKYYDWYSPSIYVSFDNIQQM